MCVWCAPVPQCTHGCQRTTCRRRFCPSTLQVLGIKPRPSSLLTSTFTYTTEPSHRPIKHSCVVAHTYNFPAFRRQSEAILHTFKALSPGHLSQFFSLSFLGLYIFGCGLFFYLSHLWEKDHCSESSLRVP